MAAAGATSIAGSSLFESKQQRSSRRKKPTIRSLFIDHVTDAIWLTWEDLILLMEAFDEDVNETSVKCIMYQLIEEGILERRRYNGYHRVNGWQVKKVGRQGEKART
jgi:hypothetical protein